MTEEATFAYVMICCCPCELPPYKPEEKLKCFIRDYYQQHEIRT